MTKLRGTPYSLHYHSHLETDMRNSVNCRTSNGNNVKDWAIRSQAPKLDMIEHGEGSTTRRLWVSYEGLINQMRLKV